MPPTVISKPKRLPIDTFRMIRDAVDRDPIGAANKWFDWWTVAQICKRKTGIVIRDYQREAIESVFKTPRNRRTVMYSGNGIGKTTLFEIIPPLWSISRPNSYVEIMGAGWDPILSKIMPLIRAGFARCKLPINLKDSMLKGEIVIRDKWRIVPISPDRPEKATGYHSDGGTLVFIDEASKVPREMGRALKTLLTGENDALFAEGNPLYVDGQFIDWINADNFHKIQVASWESPNVICKKIVVPNLATEDFIDDIRESYGEGSHEWLVTCAGQPPTESSETLISIGAIRAACAREMPVMTAKDEVCIGIDPARSPTGDESVWSVMCHTNNSLRRMVGKRGADTDAKLAITLDLLNEFRPERDAYRVKVYVDCAGGYGDALHEALTKPRGSDDPISETFNLEVIACVGSNEAQEPKRYYNQRAQSYWDLSLALNTMAIPREYERDLIREAGLKRTWKDSRMIMELKADFKERIGRSPDHFDSIAETFVKPVGSAVFDKVSKDTDADKWVMQRKPKVVESANGLWSLSLEGYGGMDIDGVLMRGLWLGRSTRSACVWLHSGTLDGILCGFDGIVQGGNETLAGFAERVVRVSRGTRRIHEYQADFASSEDGRDFLDMFAMEMLGAATRVNPSGLAETAIPSWIEPTEVDGKAGLDEIEAMLERTNQDRIGGLAIWPSDLVREIREARTVPKSKSVSDRPNERVIVGSLLRALRSVVVGGTIFAG